MKKILCLALVCLMMLAVVACNNDTDKPGDETTPSAEETTPAQVELPYKSALEIAEMAYNTIPEGDGKFPGGGAAIVIGEEGSEWALNDLGLPTEYIAKIDDAAQFKHMMNGNSFSAGVYHFKDAADIPASTEAIKETVLAKMWMCGFPEKLMIITLPGNYVVSVYGLAGVDADFNPDFVGPFVAGVKGLVEGVEVVVDTPIM